MSALMRCRPEIVLWGIALALAVTAGMRARNVMGGSPDSDKTVLASAPYPVTRERPQVLVASAEVLVTRDPFRVDRRPATVAYSPALESGPPPPPRPPRPTLAVAGIIGGPPWEALIEGVPGRQGSVLVRRGDTISGLRVRSVGRDTVHITGMDTTWTLSVRRAWQ